MDRGERAQSCGHGAGASEFAERELRVRRADQDGRPPLARSQPALEQVAERTIASAHCPSETEKRALPGIGAQPEVEPSAERIELDKNTRPALGGERR